MSFSFPYCEYIPAWLAYPELINQKPHLLIKHKPNLITHLVPN